MDRRIKLLYVSQATGGVKRHIELLAGHLDPDRFEIVGAFPPVDHIRGLSPNKETYFQLFERLGLRAIPLNMYRELNPLQDLNSFLRLIGILQKERVDILHTHSSKAGFLGRLAGRITKVPVIIHTPNAFAFSRPGCTKIMDGVYKTLERLAGHFCDALIAVSVSEAELAREVISAGKVVCIPNGIDVGEFDIPVDALAKKKELGLPQTAPLVLTVGRLASQKAPFDFLEAASQVLRRSPEVRFAFLGDGPLIEKMKKTVRQRHLERQFLIFDWREDAWEIVACCDLFVLCSLWEGMPYSILEAMVFSKPVVATEARGNRDLVVEGQTGLLVPLREPGQLAGAILRLLNDPQRARAMGHFGRRRVETQFRLETTVQATVDLYEKLLKQKNVG